MKARLPLDEMTPEEKLKALEEIWESLTGAPAELPSPPWHEDVLRNREKAESQGKSEFIPWAEAKKSIRNSTE